MNPQEAEVTPERYAVFAGFKLASVMLVRHLAELIEKLHEDRGAKVPETLDDKSSLLSLFEEQDVPFDKSQDVALS